MLSLAGGPLHYYYYFFRGSFLFDSRVHVYVCIQIESAQRIHEHLQKVPISQRPKTGIWASNNEWENYDYDECIHAEEKRLTSPAPCGWQTERKDLTELNVFRSVASHAKLQFPVDYLHITCARHGSVIFYNGRTTIMSYEIPIKFFKLWYCIHLLRSKVEEKGKRKILTLNPMYSGSKAKNQSNSVAYVKEVTCRVCIFKWAFGMKILPAFRKAIYANRSTILRYKLAHSTSSYTAFISFAWRSK